MKIHFDYQEITNPQEIPIEDLPDEDLEFCKTNPAEIQDRFAYFPIVLKQITTNEDPLLMELFDCYLAGRTFTIPVRAVQGIPQPYDAWCTDTGVIYFNLSNWQLESLDMHGKAVLLHEVTHFLIRQIQPMPETMEWQQQMDFLVFDEGISHFAGFPLGRDTLLTEHISHWEPAEESLTRAYQQLADPDLPDNQKKQILEASDTGSFWEKNGSISGMFRAAYYYENDKDKLIEYIGELKLPARLKK